MFLFIMHGQTSAGTSIGFSIGVTENLQYLAFSLTRCSNPGFIVDDEISGQLEWPTYFRMIQLGISAQPGLLFRFTFAPYIQKSCNNKKGEKLISEGELCTDALTMQSKRYDRQESTSRKRTLKLYFITLRFHVSITTADCICDACNPRK